MSNVFDVSIASWNADAVEPQLNSAAPSFTVKLTPSTTFPKGAILAELTDTPGTFGLYVHSGTNGTGVGKAILPRAVVTDASGNIYEAGQASEETVGVSRTSVPAFFGGIFFQSHLNSFDANAFADWYRPGKAVLRGTIAGSNALVSL